MTQDVIDMPEEEAKRVVGYVLSVLRDLTAADHPDLGSIYTGCATLLVAATPLVECDDPVERALEMSASYVSSIREMLDKLQAEREGNGL